MKNKFQSLIIIGSQWGDEGKGKITDYFAQKADMVVRFSGGDNAGHIIKFNNKTHKVSILPSGVFNPKVKNVIATGTVINLEKLVYEINENNVNKKNIYISDRAHLIFPFNIEIDKLQDMHKKIGTTKKGIGPTYSDKAARLGLRICDINQNNFTELLKQSVIYHNQLIKLIYKSNTVFEYEDIYNWTMKYYNIIKDCVVDTSQLISKAIEQNQIVLFEGAQGVLLDIDYGTYPFVTSSNVSASSAIIGSGIHRTYINKVIGVTKAYNTRVGYGSMPTEFENETSKKIRIIGNEFGSNTKRPRRIGWLDLVALKYAVRVGGIDQLFITLLDVLDQEKVIKLCVGYQYKNQIITNMPASEYMLQECIPIYKEFEGWQTTISNVKSFDQLPYNAKLFLKEITNFTKVKLAGFSVGPLREQTVLIEHD